MSTVANSSTRTLRLAVVNAPHLVGEISESGAEVITSDQMRTAAQLVRKELNSGERIDAIIVGDAPAVGLRGWVTYVRQYVPTIVVKSFEGVDDVEVPQINLPRALDEVLQVSGADVESNTDIVLAIDPSAPKPVRPESSFPVARPSAPSPHVQPAETESEPETAEVQPMPEDHEPEPLTEAVETPSESRPMPDDTREDETETAMQYEPEPPTTEMPHIPDTPPQVDQSHFDNTPAQQAPQQWQNQPPQPVQPPQQWQGQPQGGSAQQWPTPPAQPPQQWQNQPQGQFPPPQSQPWPMQSGQPQQWPGQGQPPRQNGPSYGSAPQQWPGQQGQGFPQPVQPSQPQPQQWPNQPAYRPSPPGQGYNQSQPVPQPAPAHRQQAPQRPPVNEDDMFFSASRSQSHAPIVIVGARKGGVGKTSTSLGIAQRGAECGLKVVLVDANMGQGGSVSVRLRIHKATHLPTIYDAAMSNNPRRSFVMPEEINHVRNQLGNLDDVAFSLVQAPTSQTSFREVVTNDAYLDVIRYAQLHADLVVVDTQIIESENHRPDALFWDKLVPLIRNDEAWLVSVTEDDRESVKNTLEICQELSEGKQISRSRILAIFNLFDPGIADLRSANRSLKAYSVPVGVVDRIDSIKKRFSAGYTPTSIREFIPVLNNILRHVTGDSQMFPRHEEVIEPENQTPQTNTNTKKKRPGFFARLFGRK